MKCKLQDYFARKYRWFLWRREILSSTFICICISKWLLLYLLSKKRKVLDRLIKTFFSTNTNRNKYLQSLYRAYANFCVICPFVLSPKHILHKICTHRYKHTFAEKIIIFKSIVPAIVCAEMVFEYFPFFFSLRKDSIFKYDTSLM